ncbi:glycoside hydrolase family 13 protein [Cryobacterium sp. BB307]|uniref:glycoside hydrolase family 13 protein n=1 Tax=Cryobacterium sp. BB307 TaxID=2716317 RepID=UPI00144760DD|nr:glycoside hydrolase family 13 protein [Cryobacterium sp. BB307]
MPLLPHHDGSALYVSNDSPELDELIRVRVRIPVGFGPVTRVHARSNPNHEPRFNEAERIARVDGWEWWEAEVLVENPEHGYRFMITTDQGIRWLNATGLHTAEPLDAEDFLVVTHAPAPSWAPSQVMYEIFPDRFARSAAADDHPTPKWAVPAAWTDPVVDRGPHTPLQFYGGDLDGIVERLDHLERLGITLLYLTPFFPGASNHRYNATSFWEVDPLLGGDDALIRLVEAAHARGIRVIGDLTSNHSGSEHEWFQTALSDENSVERDFYYWLGEDDEGDPDYVAWLGEKSLPKFNWNSTELRRRFIQGPDSVVAKWLLPPFNLDGWRIDVANMTGRYLEQDLNAVVRRTIRQTMIEVNPDTILIAESTNDASGDFRGDAWHGAMTYASFTRPVWGWLSQPVATPWYFGLPTETMPTYSGVEVHDAYVRFTAGMPWRVRAATMNALDTHDTARFATLAREAAVPVAAGLSMTLPGIPVVFAGDELGLTGMDGEDSRTPMPWATIDEHDETMTLYRELIALRNAHPALSSGGLRWLVVDDEALVFIREAAGESVLVVATRSSLQMELEPNAVAGIGSAKRLFGDTVIEPSGKIQATGPSFSAYLLPGVRIAA